MWWDLKASIGLSPSSPLDGAGTQPFSSLVRLVPQSLQLPQTKMQGRLNRRWRQQPLGEGAAGCHHGTLRPLWLRVLVFICALLVPPFCELDLLETQMQL